VAIHRSRIKIGLIVLVAGLLFTAAPTSANDSASQTLTITASVASLIVADVTSYPADCAMAPSGTGDAAWCVYQSPLTLSVASNEQWSGTIATTAGVSVSTAAGSPGLNLVAAGYPVAAASLATNHAAGISEHSLYLAQRVATNEDPARFTATITVTVTQHSSGLTYALTIPVAFNPA
jgi:hypothetical protein